MSGTGKAERPGADRPGPARRKPAPQPRPGGRPRTGARIAAVQALYQSEANAEPAEIVIEQFVRHRIGPDPQGRGLEEGQVPEADVPLFRAIVRRAAQNGEALDGIIAGHLAADWPLEKLDPVLRALLRCAAAELQAGSEPPARVVINEYLDIAHGFFGGDEPRFANGVLDVLARALRAEEFQGGSARRSGG